MSDSIISDEGKITLPENILEHLGLKRGDTVLFLTDANGRVTILPKNLTVADLKGVLPEPQESLTLEEIKDARRDSLKTD